jgi:hypothetical protein
MGFYRDWYEKLNIPWLVGREVGKKEAGALGDILDGYGDLADAATKARFPDHAPSDALPVIAGERRIFQGYGESESSWRTRLREAPDAWERAGWHLGMLLALYFDGYTDAVVVQQNGLYARLTLPLNTADPFASLTIGTLGTIATALTSSKAGGPTIPAGNPWWLFDSNTALCSRFAILLPTQPAFWMHRGVATFAGTDTAAVVWSQPFPPGATYQTVVGAPQTSDGPVVVVVDSASKTSTGVTLLASDAFTGTVDVFAWAAGENPLCCPNASALANLRRTIALWRPGKAKCVGVYANTVGKFVGWPLRTVGAGGTVGPGEVIAFAAE